MGPSNGHFKDSEVWALGMYGVYKGYKGLGFRVKRARTRGPCNYPRVQGLGSRGFRALMR